MRISVRINMCDLYVLLYVLSECKFMRTDVKPGFSLGSGFSNNMYGDCIVFELEVKMAGMNRNPLQSN